jgi:hypothetical protein
MSPAPEKYVLATIENIYNEYRVRLFVIRYSEARVSQ